MLQTSLGYRSRLTTHLLRSLYLLVVHNVASFALAICVFRSGRTVITVKLLEVYERYEILSSVLCDEYANTTKRQTAFKILIEEMRDRAFQDI